MTSVANLHPDPTPIVACTISRDVQNFDLLIDDMEIELGESWGDLSFEDAPVFLNQPESGSLEFVAIAVDGDDVQVLDPIANLITQAKSNDIKVILIAHDVNPVALHQLLRLGADDFVPYPLPEGALHDAIARMRRATTEVASDLPYPEAEPDPENRPSLKAGGDHEGVVLPVHGMAGGVGASTFACNLAWDLATVSKTDAPRVCLLDFDFQFGAVSTYLDLPRREAVFDILQDTEGADTEAFLKSMRPSTTSCMSLPRRLICCRWTLCRVRTSTA